MAMAEEDYIDDYEEPLPSLRPTGSKPRLPNDKPPSRSLCNETPESRFAKMVASRQSHCEFP